MVCDFPEDCRFLTETERAMLLARIKVDTADTHMDHLTWKSFLWIMRDWKIYCSGLMYLTCVTTSYSIALFLPTILKNMVPPHDTLTYVVGIYFRSSTTIINRSLRQRLHIHNDSSLPSRPLPPPLHLVHPRHNNLNDRLHNHNGSPNVPPRSPLLRNLPHDNRSLHNPTPHPNMVPK